MNLCVREARILCRTVLDRINVLDLKVVGEEGEGCMERTEEGQDLVERGEVPERGGLCEMVDEGAEREGLQEAVDGEKRGGMLMRECFIQLKKVSPWCRLTVTHRSSYAEVSSSAG